MSLVWRLELTNTSTGLMGECACTRHRKQSGQHCSTAIVCTSLPTDIADMSQASGNTADER